MIFLWKGSPITDIGDWISLGMIFGLIGGPVIGGIIGWIIFLVQKAVK